MPYAPRFIASLLLLVLGFQLAGTGARCLADEDSAPTTAAAAAHEHSTDCPPPEGPSHAPRTAHHGDCAMLAHCAALNLLGTATLTSTRLPSEALVVVTGGSVFSSVTTRPTPPPPRA